MPEPVTEQIAQQPAVEDQAPSLNWMEQISFEGDKPPEKIGDEPPVEEQPKQGTAEGTASTTGTSTTEAPAAGGTTEGASAPTTDAGTPQAITVAGDQTAENKEILRRRFAESRKQKAKQEDIDQRESAIREKEEKLAARERSANVLLGNSVGRRLLANQAAGDPEDIAVKRAIEEEVRNAAPGKLAPGTPEYERAWPDEVGIDGSDPKQADAFKHHLDKRTQLLAHDAVVEAIRPLATKIEGFEQAQNRRQGEQRQLQVVEQRKAEIIRNFENSGPDILYHTKVDVRHLAPEARNLIVNEVFKSAVELGYRIDDASWLADNTFTKDDLSLAIQYASIDPNKFSPPTTVGSAVAQRPQQQAPTVSEAPKSANRPLIAGAQSDSVSAVGGGTEQLAPEPPSFSEQFRWDK